MKYKKTQNSTQPRKKTNHEFYNIPLFGEVRPEQNGHFQGDYDLGEIITNSRRESKQSLNVQATDNALSGVGIFENDFLTVQLGAAINDNDIAAVKLGHKIYIRKIFLDRKHIRLETASHTPSPLIIDRNTPGFEIIGKVVAIIREL